MLYGQIHVTFKGPQIEAAMTVIMASLQQDSHWWSQRAHMEVSSIFFT